MKPRVGLTVLTSSPMIFLTMVVFPALSKPLARQETESKRSICRASYSIKMRSSLSLSLAFRRIDSMVGKRLRRPNRGSRLSRRAPLQHRISFEDTSHLLGTRRNLLVSALQNQESRCLMQCQR